MLKKILVASLPLILLIGNVCAQSLGSKDVNSGTLEKMIVASGSVSMEVDLNRLNGIRVKNVQPTELRFETERNAFFTVLVFNNELRGPLPSAMGIVPQNSAALPSKLNASFNQLVIENMSWGESYDLVVRDGKTGFVFFNIEGQQYTYEPSEHRLTAQSGRLLVSKEFASAIGRPSEAGVEIGKISFDTILRPIEVTNYVDGEVKSETMPTVSFAGSTPGPDVVVGDLSGLAQFGSSVGTQVGLAVGTDSCNFGTVDLNWFALPSVDHPVIPQNLYRMSGGASNNDRFEQIGQSNVKHAFTALTNNICSLGCNGVGSTHLGSGCSDPYSASLNAGPNLGSRAWINPFTGAYPSTANDHTGHTHTGPSHRILTEINDLSTTLNAGATYYAEAQYITPHEYAWCQANPTQCNMNNNVSYRQYSVTGTTSFSFTPVSTTQRQKTAVTAWTGSTLVPIQPAPGQDGIGSISYKVTNPSPGVWHYEYAIYNQNMDRGIQSFSIPLGSGITLSNFGFHMPPQQPGWANDGTVGNAGFSSTPWSPVTTADSVTWSSETFAQNQNANAIRWGTLYNFRFDSNRPPQAVNATLGFFKTGTPITVAIQGPTPVAAVNVTVSGRVVSAEGLGVRNARVAITGPNNFFRWATTNSYGYYSIDNVLTGATYTISATAKGMTFTPQSMPVSDNITNMNLTGSSAP
ncbi:MAG: carboxypeptidase regulatory-like domain-containing protein [Acidobacteria bacterium]|nr:carboxypeptidase regulatory-like domain-containing protein [Acidobacteriota bacterium]